MARQDILSLAEDSQLSTEQYSEQLKKAGVEEMLAQVEDKAIKYPQYYLDKFHGYAEGNLCWKAAFEAKHAWMSVALKETQRQPGNEAMTIQEAAANWGNRASGLVRQFCSDSGAPEPRTILDVGCSTGYSTRALRREFPDASITGIDASPYFLAVAAIEERLRGACEADRLVYRHALFEDLEVPPEKADLAYFQFMMHELPQAAQEANLAKAAQVVRPGGVVAFVDINPRAPALAKLPPAIKALRAASEPWLEEYEGSDVQAMFERAGLGRAVRYDMDSSHYAFFARVP